MQVRHGDLLIETILALPQGLTRRDQPILAEGETTGHAHRLVGCGAAVMERGAEVYVSASLGATVTHEEHHTVTLPPGEYRVVRQHEYDPYERAARRVAD